MNTLPALSNTMQTNSKAAATGKTAPSSEQILDDLRVERG